MRWGQLGAGAWRAAASSQPGDLRSSTVALTFPWPRGKVSVRKCTAGLGTLLLWSSPSLSSLPFPSPLPSHRSQNWRWLRLGLEARDSGSLRAGKRGSPSRPEGNSPRLRLGHFWRSPRTLPRRTPVFKLADFPQSLMVASYGPAGLSGVCTQGRRGGERNVRETRLQKTRPYPFCFCRDRSRNTIPLPTPTLPPNSQPSFLLNLLSEALDQDYSTFLIPMAFLTQFKNTSAA